VEKMTGPLGAEHDVAAALQQLPHMHRTVIMLMFGVAGAPQVPRKRLALQLGVTLEKLDSVRNEALRMLRQRPSADTVDRPGTYLVR